MRSGATGRFTSLGFSVLSTYCGVAELVAVTATEVLLDGIVSKSTVLVERSISPEGTSLDI